MNIVSTPTVHPVAAPPLTDGQLQNLRFLRTKDIQGMAGTHGGLSLRFIQFSFSAVSLSVMSSTSGFRTVTAFCYLVIAVSLQVMWCLSLALVDMYAILVRRSLTKRVVLRVFAIGDGITSTLTFAAACASAGITVLVSNDLNQCAGNPCSRFETATAMAFISWFAMTPSFVLNFWSLACDSR